MSIANLVNTFTEGVTYKIFTSDYDLNNEPIDVETDKWIPFNDHTDVYYCSKNNRTISTLKEQLRITSPDVIFINGIYSPYFNLFPAVLGTCKKIISVRGMLHPGAISQKAFKKEFYITLLKLLRLHKHSCFHASDHQEEIFIKNVFGKNANVYVAPNFPRTFSYQPVYTKTSGTLKLVTIALVSPMKNYLNVLEAMMNVKESITYNIYGPIKDASYWNECKKVINNLPKNIQVIYHGDIHPKNVEQALSTSEVYIQPSKSENFGHSIYEALAAGKPVITSNAVPWKHLNESGAGKNINPENIAELSSAINFFADMDQQDYNKWSTGAAAYARNAVDPEKIKTAYKQMFQLS
ncbi:hypothetical protein BH09BAC2_BH09BAC2_15730 [soil metagenome]